MKGLMLEFLLHLMLRNESKTFSEVTRRDCRSCSNDYGLMLFSYVLSVIVIFFLKMARKWPESQMLVQFQQLMCYLCHFLLFTGP